MGGQGDFWERVENQLPAPAPVPAEGTMGVMRAAVLAGVAALASSASPALRASSKAAPVAENVEAFQARLAAARARAIEFDEKISSMFPAAVEDAGSRRLAVSLTGPRRATVGGEGAFLKSRGPGPRSQPPLHALPRSSSAPRSPSPAAGGVAVHGVSDLPVRLRERIQLGLAGQHGLPALHAEV